MGESGGGESGGGESGGGESGGGESGGNEIIVRGKAQPAQKRSGKPGGWSAERRKTFLDVLASSSNVRLAARAVGVRASAVYDLRSRDPAFAAMWQEALAIGYDRLEHALLERARLGANDIEIEGDVPLLVGKLDDQQSGSAARLIEGRVEMDVKLAQWLLDRHDKTVRSDAGTIMSTRPSREAIEAKIVRKLESLKKQGRFDR